MISIISIRPRRRMRSNKIARVCFINGSEKNHSYCKADIVGLDGRRLAGPKDKGISAINRSTRSTGCIYLVSSNFLQPSLRSRAGASPIFPWRTTPSEFIWKHSFLPSCICSFAISSISAVLQGRRCNARF